MVVKPSRESFEKLPEAIAIIMDGNGRWAQERALPRAKGHEVGAESVRAITRECARLGLKELTLYAFSTENWKRPTDEVGLLMQLLERYLIQERSEIMENGIVFRAIGELDRLPSRVSDEYERTRDMSAKNGGMVLRLAFRMGRGSSSSRPRRRSRRSLPPRSRRSARTISGSSSTTRRMQDPDLLVRTAGEQRLSNYLLWQASYAELYFTKTLWPEFREAQLHDAFKAYAERVRRFGGLVSDEG